MNAKTDADRRRRIPARALVILLCLQIPYPAIACSDCNPREQYLQFLEHGDSGEALSAEQRRGLSLWQAEHDAQAAMATEPDRDSLEAILGELQRRHEKDADRSLLLRMLHWLRDRLEQGETQDAPDWMVKFFEDIDAAQLEEIAGWILYGTMALLLILLAAIVINEVRAVNRLRRPADWHPHARKIAATGNRERPVHSLDDVRRLPAAQQPPALLRLAIRALALKQYLPVDDSLTNAEMADMLLTAHPQQAGAFRKLCEIAESVLYGGRRVEASTLEQAMLLTRKLLQPAGHTA